MRTRKTIAELWREQTGREYITGLSAEDGKPLRWHWIDYPFLSFGELLQLTGLPKGRIESFLRREVLVLSASEPGSGKWLTYTPRDALKLIAADGLVAVGAGEEPLWQLFRRNGPFDLKLNGYQFRQHSDASPTDVCLLGRDPDSWAYSLFDMHLFLRETMPRVLQFFRDQGVSVRD